MRSAAAPSGSEPPARWARWYAGVFLAAFVVAGLVGIEAWPLTGWRLFADARTARQVSWLATTVDSTGHEAPIPFADLPAGFHGNVQVLKGFATDRPERQLAVCQAWTDAVRARGVDVREVRIYQVRVDVSRRAGDRGAPGERTLRYVCSGGMVHAAG